MPTRHPTPSLGAIPAIALALALAVAPQAARAQSGGSYGLSWSTIDGGGAASTGGAYAVTGTAGQPDAGNGSGGVWTLSGGFWRAGLMTTGIPPASETVPSRFQLFAARPNPFIAGTTFALDLPTDGPVTVIVYDISGHRVRDLYSGRASAGRLELRWDAADDTGRPVHSGVYFARVSAGPHVATSKVILLSEGGAR